MGQTIYPHSNRNVGNVRVYFMKYCPSHKTLLWIWIISCMKGVSYMAHHTSSLWYVIMTTVLAMTSSQVGSLRIKKGIGIANWVCYECCKDVTLFRSIIMFCGADNV